MQHEEAMTTNATSRRAFRLDSNDLGLLFVVVVWGVNLSVVKWALGEMLPLAFNAVRFTLAGVTLLVLLRLRGETLRTSLRDGLWLVALGLVGHTAYQVLFIEGIDRTTATHAALISGITPIAIGILSQALGHERIGAGGWAGAALAFGGIYLIIAGKAPAGGAAPSLAGDLLILGAALGWSVYTVLGRPLLERHSPLKVTAISMGWGTLALLPICLPEVGRQQWGDVGAVGWGSTAFSFVFALVVAYVLWYRSVRKVGNLRTAIYSNLTPVTGTLSGWLFLREPLYPALGFGAALIFTGIALTRLRRGADVRPAPEQIGEEF